MPRTPLAFLLPLAPLAIVATVPTYAQTLTSATIVGTVSDSSGAVVPDADVTAVQRETGEAHRTKSNASGDYRFPFLKPGEYTITAAGAGLSEQSVTLQLQVGKEQSVRIVLGLQAMTQSVDVQAASDLLQTENANALQATHNNILRVRR